jgi:hypothetical protein
MIGTVLAGGIVAVKKVGSTTGIWHGLAYKI